MEGTCQCKKVKFTTSAPAPTRLLFCHCSLCRHQSSSAFGSSAEFPDFALDMTSQPVSVYSRDSLEPGLIKDHFFCSNCGSRLMHKYRTPDQKVGETCEAVAIVKAGCLEGLDWSKHTHIFVEDAVTEITDGAPQFIGSNIPKTK